MRVNIPRRWRRAFAAFAIAVGAVAVVVSAAPGAPAPKVWPAVAVDNTPPGAPAGLTYAPESGWTVSVADEVIADADITGTLTIAAPNVVIRNTKLHPGNGDYYGIRVASGSVLISHVTISGGYLGAGIAGDNWTADKVEITGVVNDATNMGNHTRLTNSLLHNFTPCAQCHSDGVQVFQKAGDITIQGNNIDVGTGNSAIILTADVQQTPYQPGPVTIDGNGFAGGTYTVHITTAFPAQVTNNTWRRGAWKWGPIYPDPAPPMFTGNTFDDGSVLCWPGTTCTPPATSTTTSAPSSTTTVPPTSTTTTTSPSSTTTTTVTTSTTAPAAPTSFVCPVIVAPTVGQQILCTYR